MNKINKTIPLSENNLKVQWACRRGMLELDVLLGNFFKDCYMQLSSENKNQFIRLLNYADTELFDWLLGLSQPPDNDLAMITYAIREHAKARI